MSALDAKRQRSAFTDALRPPPGHVLGACLGTTYSLDFDAFTAVILAFVGADVEDPLNDAPSVLTTVARLRSRLRQRRTLHSNLCKIGEIPLLPRPDRPSRRARTAKLTVLQCSVNH